MIAIYLIKYGSTAERSYTSLCSETTIRITHCWRLTSLNTLHGFSQNDATILKEIPNDDKKHPYATQQICTPCFQIKKNNFILSKRETIHDHIDAAYELMAVTWNESFHISHVFNTWYRSHKCLYWYKLVILKNGKLTQHAQSFCLRRHR